jgi:hypothetical protein
MFADPSLSSIEVSPVAVVFVIRVPIAWAAAEAPLISNFALGLAVPMPTLPLLVAKLAPVVLDNAPVTASPVEFVVVIVAPLILF